MSFRYDPFEQMNRLFEQMRRPVGMGMDPSWSWEGAQRQDRPAFGPAMGWHSDESTADRSDVAVDQRDDWHSVRTNVPVEPTDEGYVVMADLPGFETEDLSIRFDDGVLAIEGESEFVNGGEQAARRRSRRVYERLTFPESVVVEDITASYRNGVLEIVLPTEADVADDAHHIDID